MIFILCAIIMLQAGILYRLWQQRRQAELLARNRLRYIEEWLDLLYLAEFNLQMQQNSD